jgi:hypothetical protein
MLFEKVILKITQRHFDKGVLFNASQFGFFQHTTLQCMRLMGHVKLNFNNNMSMAAVFLDIEKSFGTTWHLGLLYKLSELKFFISLIKLIFFSFSEKPKEFWSKVKSLSQGIYQQECHKVPTCPQIVQYMCK